ncbi:MAG: hypothetical protein IJ371_01205 [Clostridia bacterium]|nr:hypothetical protein [Clostridia bacterium]
MEKITCNVLYNAKVQIKMENVKGFKYDKLSGKVKSMTSFQDYTDLGMFTYKKDAFLAIEVYKKILEVAELNDVKPCEEYMIDRNIFPEKEMADVKYYNNVLEFVKDNLMIAKCQKKIGKDKVNKILVDLGVKMDENQERIVERMVSDYIYQSRMGEIENASPKTIVDYKENIKFLKDLSNAK